MARCPACHASVYGDISGHLCSGQRPAPVRTLPVGDELPPTQLVQPPGGKFIAAEAPAQARVARGPVASDALLEKILAQLESINTKLLQILMAAESLQEKAGKP